MFLNSKFTGLHKSDKKVYANGITKCAKSWKCLPCTTKLMSKSKILLFVDILNRAMTEVQTEFGAFRQRTVKKNEKTDFSVISGDFNIDNISPGRFLKKCFCNSYRMTIRLERPINK